MRLTVLGSGDAFHGAGANACYCLDGRLLVDCGAPVHVVGRRHGVPLEDIETLLLTHFHFDHCSQVPLLLGARALLDGPPRRLRLAGPVGTREYVLRLIETGYGAQLRGLIEDHLGLEAVVLGDGDEADIDGYRVHADAVVHSVGPSLAYAVTGPDGVTIGFSGDSTDCPGLRRWVGRCDLAVCECTGWDGPVRSHLWAGEVAELIRSSPQTRFLISHLAERRRLDGALVAHDGLSLDVSAPGAEPPRPPASLGAAS